MTMNNILNFIAILAVSLSLTACAARQPSVEVKNDIGKELIQKKAVEEAAWRKVQQLSASKCNFTPAPPQKSKAVAMSTCMSSLIKAHVMPKAAFPEIIVSDRAKALRIAENYAKGKITPVQYKQMSEARLKNYKSTWMSKAHQEVLDAASKQYWLGDKT